MMGTYLGEGLNLFSWHTLADSEAIRSNYNFIPKNPQAVSIPPTAIETKSNPVVTFLDSIVGVLSIPNEAEMKPFAVSEKSIQPYWTNALNLFSGLSLQVVTSSSETSYSEKKN